LRPPPGFVPIAFVLASILALASAATGLAVDRPAYMAGDRWVYELSGSLGGLPGMNETDIGSFSLSVAARVEVAVRSAADAGLEVSTRTTGYLNGTFELPDGSIPGTVTVTGTLTSVRTETWEPDGFLAVEARDRTTYVADVALFLPVRFEVDLWTNATTLVDAGAVFPLEVGGRATASLETNVSVDTIVRAFGSTMRSSNETTISSEWSREALAEETVTVEAGTFRAVRLNQSLGAFPGIPVLGGVPGGNETAFWSNDVRYYVRTTAYVNGTPALTMQLKSFTAGTTDSFLLPVLIGASIAAACVIVLALLRRRSKGASRPEGSEGRGSKVQETVPEGSRAR